MRQSPAQGSYERGSLRSRRPQPESGSLRDRARARFGGAAPAANSGAAPMQNQMQNASVSSMANSMGQMSMRQQQQAASQPSQPQQHQSQSGAQPGFGRPRNQQFGAQSGGTSSMGFGSGAANRSGAGAANRFGAPRVQQPQQPQPAARTGGGYGSRFGAGAGSQGQAAANGRGGNSQPFKNYIREEGLKGSLTSGSYLKQVNLNSIQGAGLSIIKRRRSGNTVSMRNSSYLSSIGMGGSSQPAQPDPSAAMQNMSYRQIREAQRQQNQPDSANPRAAAAVAAETARPP